MTEEGSWADTKFITHLRARIVEAENKAMKADERAFEYHQALREIANEKFGHTLETARGLAQSVVERCP